MYIMPTFNQFTKKLTCSLVDRYFCTLQVRSKFNIVVPTSEKFSCEDGLKLLIKEILQVHSKISKVFMKNQIFFLFRTIYQNTKS